MPFLLGTLVLIVGTYFLGRWIERRHFDSIEEREKELADITMTDLREPPAGVRLEHGQLVTGATVVAADYFKSFAASIRTIFGGEMRSLERMVERARRESVLRMLAEARGLGADAVYNVRIDTSTIGGKRSGSTAGVEVLASGTAVKTSQ